MSAVAIHDYANITRVVVKGMLKKYPELDIQLTERSYCGVDGEYTTGGQWQGGIRRVMDFYRNGISSWSYWLTFLDTNGGPSTGPLNGACCSLPFTAPPGNLDAYTTNRDYYLYGQFSRFVQRGTVRIGSDETSTDVSNVAFRNPDGTIVTIVANGATEPRSVTVTSPDGSFSDTLPAHAMATYKWAAGHAPADPRLGSFRLANRGNTDMGLKVKQANVLSTSGDTYRGRPGVYKVGRPLRPRAPGPRRSAEAGRRSPPPSRQRGPSPAIPSCRSVVLRPDSDASLVVKRHG
ncbi:glycoside hydrolase family 30 beta sandwich domain-containing protein [Streptomyces sp. NPDC059340]|uniref:glycoside hydrolase family 30 beta sandwich domain-containing protein n=1 Tax=Streptomyces sp. NPDC059340 TaxID=3346806 RepID=UPI0036B224C3